VAVGFLFHHLGGRARLKGQCEESCSLAFTDNRGVGLGLKIYGLAILMGVMAAILVFLRRRQRA